MSNKTTELSPRLELIKRLSEESKKLEQLTKALIAKENDLKLEQNKVRGHLQTTDTRMAALDEAVRILSIMEREEIQ